MMATVNPTIFRKYDIRGTAVEPNPQLTPDLARLVGQALGTYLPRQFGTERVFVGMDNRLTSPPLKTGMIEGLLSTGMNVTDIGAVITPTVYFASASYAGKAAGVQITGSHLTTQYNGIKMAYGPLALADTQIQDLLALIQADEFAQGTGELSHDFDMMARHFKTIAGMVRLERKMKVVVDAGNGVIGPSIKGLLESVGCEVTGLYLESDGTYPNHLPNPEDPTTTHDLEALVVSSGADLGLAFDGDSDRCGFIDEHGHHIAADRLLAVLAIDTLKKYPGATIIYDVKTSQVLPDIIRAHGGVPLMWKTGHSLMKAKMHEVNAPIGGEVSGHLFVKGEYYGFDDAPLVALKALEIFSRTTKTVSEVFAALPTMLATPEIILSAPDDIKFRIIDDITEGLQKEFDVFTLDGARANFEHGWGLVRASNTQPAITLRFEAATPADLVTYMQRFKVLLDHFPQVDQAALTTQIERFSKA
jgi:phosphomannomutase/phosphoglucomutase